MRRLHVPGAGQRKVATPAQRHLLARLSREAGVETPVGIFWASDADKAIRRLKRYLGQRDQLRLDGMDAIR